MWIEPIAPRYTSEAVLTQEESIITWALAAQAVPPSPSNTVDRTGLDVLQAEAAASVAGDDRLVLVVGPAGAGKTRMLTAASDDLHQRGRDVFGVAPTAKAARTLERDTGIRSDTVAKLLHEWQRTDRTPLSEFQLPAGATLIIDEAGMLSTPALHQIVNLADRNAWRVALVGDHRQLQGVGRGGLLSELCANGRVEQLERLHRFTHHWEAAASLLLRCGDPSAFDAYEAHGRIIPGTIDDHLARMADSWITGHHEGRPTALVASTNDHVDTINRAVQQARLEAGHLDPVSATRIAGGDHAHVGDVVATRRNDRHLTTTTGETVRNRELWTVTATNSDGSLIASHHGGHGCVTLPNDYVRGHVQLGYAATEHGWQSDTVDTAIALTSPSTTRRGLYVAATRASDENVICVITHSADVTEARDVLEGIVAVDRADVPAVTQRHTLAQQARDHEPAATPAAPRCRIPEWFPPLLADARAEVARLEQRDAERQRHRDRLEAAAESANHAFRTVEHDTAPDRDELWMAERRVDKARWNHAAAQRQLDASPRRSRRTARRNVDEAQWQLDRAARYVERVRERAGPGVDRYQHALADRTDAARDLDLDDTSRHLDAFAHELPDARRRLTALDCWQRWANGHDLSPKDFHDAVEVLTAAGSCERESDTTLGRQMTHDAGLTRARPNRTPIGPVILDRSMELEF